MNSNLSTPIITRLPESNRLERIWKLAQTDFKKRYFNTKLGVLWALINPIFRLSIYLFVFSFLGGFKTENFGLYIFSALILWMSFSETTVRSISTLKQKRYLLENIQFNIVDLYISNTLSVFLGFLFNLLAYIVVAIMLGISFSFQLLWLPVILLILVILNMGVSMILASINIYLKDIHHLWDMMLFAGFWTIPSIFPLENFTGYLEYLIYLNPMGGILINFRNVALYDIPINFYFLGHSLIYALALFLIGLFFIKRHWQNALERF